MSWTQSSGQVSKTDTVACYKRPELQKIAAKLVLADKLIQSSRIDSLTIALLQKNIKDHEANRADLEKSLVLKDEIIRLKEEDISTLEKSLKKVNRQKKWLKFGWGASVAVLLGGATYLILQ